MKSADLRQPERSLSRGGGVGGVDSGGVADGAVAGVLAEAHLIRLARQMGGCKGKTVGQQHRKDK